MARHQGTVGFVNSKPAGRGTVYSFVLQGEDGIWYKLGFNKPDFAKGDYIQFEWTEGQWGPEVDLNTVVKPEGSGSPQQQGAPTTSQPRQTAKNTSPRAKSSGNGLSRDDYWANKESRDIEKDKAIMYQSAIKSATDVATAALANQAVSLPAAKGKKLDAFLALIDTLADRYYVAFVKAPTDHEKRMVAGLPAEKAARPDEVEAVGGAQKSVEQNPYDDFDDDIPFG